MNDKIGPTYNDTNEPIKVGDLVLFDTLVASVQNIFLPNTPEAEGCGCEDTGAVSIRDDNGIPVLIPFGNWGRIVKRLESE